MMRDAIELYLAALLTRGYSKLTAINQRSHLQRFATFIEGRFHGELGDVTRDSIEAYLEHLASCARPLTPVSRNLRLSSIRAFCRWLVERDIIAADPTKLIIYARTPDRLPRTLPSVDAVQKLIAAADARSRVGYRDRVVLELLYQSGLRVAELCALDVVDVDLVDGFAHVRCGKGGRGRVVPIGRLAVELLTNYLAHVRPKFVKRHKEVALIVSRNGERLHVRGAQRVVARCAERAGLDAHVTPHVLRHTCATHMLRGGANIRHLQEMLGHQSLSSTQIYTRVTAGELKDVHARFHPRGSLDEVEARKPRLRKRTS